MVIIATARMNDYDWDKVIWVVLPGGLGCNSGPCWLSVIHGVSRLSLKNSPGTLAWEECHFWGPFSRVLGPSLAKAGSWSHQDTPTPPFPLPARARELPHGVALVLTLARTFFSLTRRF